MSTGSAEGRHLQAVRTEAIRPSVTAPVPPGGTIEARWQLAGEKEIFEMAWLERGGPPVTPPRRQGFGYTVIVRMVEHALDAEVALDHSVTGLYWRLRAPAPGVLDGPKRASAGTDVGSTP